MRVIIRVLVICVNTFNVHNTLHVKYEAKDIKQVLGGKCIILLSSCSHVCSINAQSLPLSGFIAVVFITRSQHNTSCKLSCVPRNRQLKMFDGLIRFTGVRYRDTVAKYIFQT